MLFVPSEEVCRLRQRVICSALRAGHYPRTEPGVRAADLSQTGPRANGIYSPSYISLAECRASKSVGIGRPSVFSRALLKSAGDISLLYWRRFGNFPEPVSARPADAPPYFRPPGERTVRCGRRLLVAATESDSTAALRSPVDDVCAGSVELWPAAGQLGSRSAVLRRQRRRGTGLLVRPAAQRPAVVGTRPGLLGGRDSAPTGAPRYRQPHPVRSDSLLSRPSLRLIKWAG